jgi:hypothetical protein
VLELGGGLPNDEKMDIMAERKSLSSVGLLEGTVSTELEETPGVGALGTRGSSDDACKDDVGVCPRSGISGTRCVGDTDLLSSEGETPGVGVGGFDTCGSSDDTCEDVGVCPRSGISGMGMLGVGDTDLLSSEEAETPGVGVGGGFDTCGSSDDTCEYVGVCPRSGISGMGMMGVADTDSLEADGTTVGPGAFGVDTALGVLEVEGSFGGSVGGSIEGAVGGTVESSVDVGVEESGVASGGKLVGVVEVVKSERIPSTVVPTSLLELELESVLEFEALEVVLESVLELEALEVVLEVVLDWLELEGSAGWSPDSGSPTPGRSLFVSESNISSGERSEYESSKCFRNLGISPWQQGLRRQAALQ